MPTKKTNKTNRRTSKSTNRKKSNRNRTSMMSHRNAASSRRSSSRTSSSRRKPSTSHRGGQSLENMTKQELYARARATHVEGRSGMSKGELLRALRRG